MDISLIIFWIIIGALIALLIDFSFQLCRTIKEITEDTTQEKQIYCPYCGSNETNQITKMIIVMQLPGKAVECACFYCSNCSKRWFMELDTLKQKDLFPIGTYT